MAPTRSLKVVISGDSRDFDRALKSADRGLARFDVAVGNSTHKTEVFQNTLNLIKPAALISGMGAAAQAVSALGAAGVAAGAALAPLAGGAAGTAGSYVALGQAAGVAKLALSGLGEALQGNADALKKLTPTQKSFVQQVQATMGQARALRAVAQRGLLPGLEAGLKSVTPLFDRLRPVVGGTARVMGDLARTAGGLAGSGGVLDMVSRIGATNIAVIRHLGTGAIALAHGLLTVLDVARPLTLWFSRLAEKTGLLINGQVNLAAKTGALSGFFEQTRVVMSRVGRIAGDLAVAFFNVAKAGKPLGDEILVGLVRAADQFRKFTDSARGQNAIKQFFDQARPGIFAFGRLIQDALKAFGAISSGTQVAPLIEMIRTQLLPVFTQLVVQTTAAFGPVLINAIGNLARLFGSLTGSSGPLVMFVQLIGAAAGGLARLLQGNPALQTMVVTIAGLAAVIKAVKFVGMVTGLTTVIGAVNALKVAYMAETGAQSASTLAAVRWKVATVAGAIAGAAAGVATKALTAGQWLLNAALTANPIGLVVVGLVALGAGLVVAYKKSETFRKVVDASWAAVRDTTMTV
jgi:hypothetical protein